MIQKSESVTNSISTIMFTIIVPTWKRPGKLKTCLEHLFNQSRKADQLVVVLREIDTESIEIVRQFIGKIRGLEMVFVDKPGVIAAENAGLRNANGNYIAFIDDDGYAPVSWLEQIENFFHLHPEAGALGGSDIIKSEPWSYYDCHVTKVGLLSWNGKIIGNHHRKCEGSIRRVQVLKGVNMAFKRSTFEYLDEKLAGIEGHLGNGSQWELDLCLTLVNKNIPIYFDPSLVVIHDSDHSKHDKLISAKNNAHNLSYVMAKHLSPIRYSVFLLYALIWGNEQLPGLIKTFVDSIRSKTLFPLKIYLYKLNGFFQGISTKLFL